MKMYFYTLLFAVTLLTNNAQGKEPEIHYGGFTNLTITDEQVIQFENDGFITLTPRQKELIKKRTNHSLTKVTLTYLPPDGEYAETAHNVAVRLSKYKIRLLHQYLAEPMYKLPEEGHPVESRDKGEYIPWFFVDGDGVLWQPITQSDFKAYVERYRTVPNISVQFWFTRPASIESAKYIRAQDTIRKLQREAHTLNIPSQVVMPSGKIVTDADSQKPL